MKGSMMARVPVSDLVLGAWLEGNMGACKCCGHDAGECRGLMEGTGPKQESPGLRPPPSPTPASQEGLERKQGRLGAGGRHCGGWSRSFKSPLQS